MEGKASKEAQEPSAQDTWHKAKKLRKSLLDRIDDLKKGTTDDLKLQLFESIEKFLSSFREACVHTIFRDFQYAVTEKVENSLWQFHSLVNTEYRRALGRLKSPQQAVVKHKLEKLYVAFLRTAQHFYKGYVQRLDARFKLKELDRAVTGIKIRKMVIAESAPVLPEPAQQAVIDSCYQTIVHLGDLSRYRSQAQQKVPTYDSALSYFSLARDILPSSGHADHQIGIVCLDQKKHFEVIYHFYLAWANVRPHPNARANLESEFRSLMLPSAPSAPMRNSGPPDANEAFTKWFSKLHANIYKGEIFSSHGELEDEVIHRLALTGKEAKNFDMLFKMVLINIAAYFKATEKLKVDKWTMQGARFCQFALRLNLRFIHTICKLLKTEIETLLERNADVSEEDAANQKSCVKTTPTIDSTLALLRIYMVWVVANREDIITAMASLEQYVQEILLMVPKVLNLLVKTYQGGILGISKYLLPEDQVIVGFVPLEDSRLETGCRIKWDEDNGQLKPSISEYTGQRLDSTGELLCRVLNILQCGYFLAEDIQFPFAVNLQESLDFYYVEEASSPQNSNPYAAQHRKITDGVSTAENGLPQSASLTSMAEHNSSHQENQNTVLPVAATAPAPPHATNLVSVKAGTDTAVEDSEFAADTEMLNLVNEFLTPPEPPRRRSQLLKDDSSYGMGSTTANEVFGQAAYVSPITGGSATKPIPNLPWAFFNTPTPQDAAGTTNERLAFESPSGTARNSYVRGASFLEDPFLALSTTSMQASVPDAPTAGQVASLGDQAEDEDEAELARRHIELLRSTGEAARRNEDPPVGLSPSFLHQSRAPRGLAIMTSPTGERQSVPEISHSMGLASPPSHFGTKAGHGGPFNVARSAEYVPVLPMGSAYSEFSHPSSMYMGTPYQGPRSNLASTVGRGQTLATIESAAYQNADHGAGALSSMATEAAEYNKKVLASAWVSTTSPRGPVGR